MVISLLISALLTAPGAPLKLAFPGLQTVGIDQKLGSFYGEHLAQQLTLQGAQVVTAAEISALLGFERQKQLLGCTNEASICMAELANALGADGMVLGDVARVGTTFTLNLKVLSARDTRRLASFSSQAESAERALIELTRATALPQTEACTFRSGGPGPTTCGSQGRAEQSSGGQAVPV